MTMYKVNNVNGKPTSPRLNKIWVHIELLVQIKPEKSTVDTAYGECVICRQYGWLDGRYGWAFNMARAKTKLKKTRLNDMSMTQCQRQRRKRRLKRWGDAAKEERIINDALRIKEKARSVKAKTETRQTITETSRYAK